MNNISTPIFDFVQRYAKCDNVRMHMPGHKGKNVLGIERLDITEIHGADSMYEAEGIIAESERNLSNIYGTKASFYSTEGSSLCIRAMLHAALKIALQRGKKRIAAARNVHKAYVYSSALLDFETLWLTDEKSNLYSCQITPEQLEKVLFENDDIGAVYITSPDYLGNIADVKGLSEVCKRNDVPLLVDNAHGAYLKFTLSPMHPIDLGADMCCDSAHKTLPVLTGGAYLHVSNNCKYGFEDLIKSSMSLFASTSPSYVILSSLDAANKILCDGYDVKVAECTQLVNNAKMQLSDAYYGICGDEPHKLTLKTKQKGYFGYEIAQILENNSVYPESCDRDNVVLMFSPYNSFEDVQTLCKILCSVETKKEIVEKTPKIGAVKPKISVREAVMSISERVCVEKAKGRILASPSVSCPPAIPIAICGEELDENAINCFKYYGIKEIDVVKE